MAHVNVGCNDLLEMLLVEDSRDESRRLRNAFEKETVDTTLHTVSTSEAALDDLFRRGEDTSTPFPDIVLIDLPSGDVLELLAEIKDDRRFGHIPVLVVVEIDTEDNIGQYYKHGANACLKRTNEYDRLVSAIESFWWNQVQLPRK